MACRICSKLWYGRKWILVFSMSFLLILIISSMVITLPPPFPSTDSNWRLSGALSFVREFRYRPRMADSFPATDFQLPFSNVYSSTWKTGSGKLWAKYLVEQKHTQTDVSDDKNRNKAKKHADIHRNKYRSKRKEPTGAIQLTRHQQPPHSEFIVNNTEMKFRIMPNSHSYDIKHTAQTYTRLERTQSPIVVNSSQADIRIREGRPGYRQADMWENRSPSTTVDRQIRGSHTNVKQEQHQALDNSRHTVKHSGKSDNGVKYRLSVQKPSRDYKTYHNLIDFPEVEAIPRFVDRREVLSKLSRAPKKDKGDGCQSITEQDFSDTDHRKIRISTDSEPLPWLSEDDIKKMELLAEGKVVSKARVPAHGQVLQVVLDPPASHQSLPAMRNPHQNGAEHGHAATHSERCQQGRCALIKRSEDWFEVFAFHLDRVLGLNRSLPAVLRTFHSNLLPYRYITSTPRPAVWWDPDIQHLTDKEDDQNSVALSWVQYQRMLQARCGRETDLWSQPCLGVHHSEWTKLALLDFLLQVNDRLDRYCCGFTPDPGELCVEDLLHTKCGNSKDLLLVHILVRKTDPSRLVFIDNAGRPQQATDNLNFRLIEGIDEFPEKAVSVLHSGCLASFLMRSLYTDKEFWDSHGGASGLQPIIHMVEQRGKILLQHTRDKNLWIKRDL